MEFEREEEELMRLESRLKYAQAVLHCAEVDESFARAAVTDQRFWVALKRARLAKGEKCQN